jgi:hypothetical protein
MKRAISGRNRVALDIRAIWVLFIMISLLFSGCAFPPPIETTVPELLSNPRDYVNQRIEVSGTVEWGGKGHRDFEYWHFHLKKDGEEIVCYSEAYKYQVWSAIDNVIRRAAASGKEVTVVGYVVPWGSGRAVLRAKWITYEGRTYDAEFIPPAVSAVLFTPGVAGEFAY